MRKRVKWYVEQLFASRLIWKSRHRLKEELRETEYEEVVHICEPKQGGILGEDGDNVDGDFIFDTSNEAKELMFLNMMICVWL